MTTIVAICPYCRAGGVRAPAASVGASATCPKCKSNFTVMPSEGAPSRPQPKPAEPTAETQPAPAVPDVTEPSPVLPPEPKAKSRKAEPPQEPAAELAAPEPAAATDFGLVAALAALALVGAAVLASQLPFGRFVAAGLSGVGLLAGLAALGAEGKARLAGAAAAGLHALVLLIVFLLPSWLNLGPWRAPPDDTPKGPFAVDTVTGERRTLAPGEWLDPSAASWEHSDVRVTARTAYVGPVELRGPKDERRATKDDYLVLQFRIEAVGVGESVALSDWAAGRRAAGVRITDAAGKVLAPATFAGPWQPETAEPVERLYPGKSAVVTLTHAATAAAPGPVRVELSGAGLGLPDETIRFQFQFDGK